MSKHDLQHGYHDDTIWGMIDPEDDERMGLTDRPAALQFTRLCRGYNELKSENARLRFKIDWLFGSCKVVFFPAIADSLQPYPYEHNPHMETAAAMAAATAVGAGSVYDRR